MYLIATLKCTSRYGRLNMVLSCAFLLGSRVACPVPFVLLVPSTTPWSFHLTSHFVTNAALILLHEKRCNVYSLGIFRWKMDLLKWKSRFQPTIHSQLREYSIALRQRSCYLDEAKKWHQTNDIKMPSAVWCRANSEQYWVRQKTANTIRFGRSYESNWIGHGFLPKRINPRFSRLHLQQSLRADMF